jgi:hypothetical protein
MRTNEPTRAGIGSLLLAGFVVATSACNTLMDLDRFKQVSASEDGGQDSGQDSDVVGNDAGTFDGDRDLVIVLQRMAPHPTQLFEFRIVDGANRVQTRGLLDPLGEQDVTIHVPVSVSEFGGPYRLDMYADQNDTRSYDGLGSGTTNDHAWRIPLEASTRRGRTVEVSGTTMTLTFLHDTVFTNIDTDLMGNAAVPGDTGLDAKISFSKLPASYQGVPLQVRIANADTDRTVGLYRFPQAKAPPFDAVIPGVVEGEVAYNISVYIDVNGNGEYENPSAGGPDKGWCQKRTADATKGLEFAFDPDLAGDGKCDVGAP